MLSASGQVKIIDFGLAKLFNHDAVSREHWPLFHSLRRCGGDLFPLIWALETNPHTTNEPFGTQGFTPPEVWQGKNYSYGVDYFAMGCVLYELLTGKVRDSLPPMRRAPILVLASIRVRPYYRQLRYLVDPCRP